MKVFSLLISLFVGTAVSKAQVFPHEDGDIRHYAAVLDMRKTAMTGLVIMKQEDNQLIGTLMNEFGFKAFDMVANRSKGKVKLVNVASIIDKWYILRIIRADLRALIRYDSNPAVKVSRHREITRSDSILTLRNTHYNLTYSFKLLPQTTGQ